MATGAAHAKATLNGLGRGPGETGRKKEARLIREAREPPDPDDRRAKRLYMTEQSRQSFAELAVLGDILMAEVTAGLSSEEVESLRSLLLRLRTNILKPEPLHV